MEAMAIEALVATVWELDEYLTRARWAVPTDSGQYSDIDVVGVAGQAVRLAECKVRGPAATVWVVPEGVDIEGWLGDWADSLVNVDRLWGAPPAWLPQGRDATIEFWYCANVWFPSVAVRRAADAQLTRLAAARAPRHGDRVEARFYTTLDLVIMAVERVRSAVEGRGRRFGDPILDVIRELVRYTSARASGGGRGASAQIVEESVARLAAAVTG